MASYHMIAKLSAQSAKKSASRWRRRRADREDGHSMKQRPTFDLIGYIFRQREWSKASFGPGDRARGIVDHIRKELLEIEANPTDITEWIDVAILADRKSVV